MSELMCHYLPSLMAVSTAQAAQADEVLNGVDGIEFNFLDQSSLFELLGGEAQATVLQTMLTIVAPVRVDGLEVHDVAGILRESGVDASPVHGLGSLNHVSAMPGNEPVVVQADRKKPWHFPDPYGVVAVVDSGVTSEVPGWVNEGLRFDPEDLEPTPGPGGASHGTFVAGLIRMIAPNHVVSVARARPNPTSGFLPPLNNLEEGLPTLTTELDVLYAIIRLVDRHTGDEVDVLNLSLGGMACGEMDPTLVVLSLAIDYWRQHFPRSVVFAAGGNTPETAAIFPAAFNHVRAVAAARPGGALVAWDPGSPSPRQPVDIPRRPWITDVAPGVDIIGPSGVASDPWVQWSGSSFASAVAAACFAGRRPMQAQNDLVWWRNRAMDYHDVTGLMYR